MRRGTLVVGVLGAVLAVVGFELGDPWPLRLGLILGGAGTVCTLAALWLQHREGSPFEYHVTESSWKPYSPDEFYLEIGRSEHGKGRSPEATLYMKNAATGTYSLVEPDFTIEPSGTVYIVVGKRSRISGKVVIR